MKKLKKKYRNHYNPGFHLNFNYKYESKGRGTIYFDIADLIKF